MTDNFYAPPHSIEAEQAVIGGLLLDDDSSERVQKVLAMLKPDSFYSRPHKILFEEITRMHREQKPVDGLTLFDELERKSLTASVGGFAYIAEIAKNTPSAANIVAYAMQVREADVIPVYAAAPASVVPDNASEPLAYAYKELTPEIMRNHLAVFERYGIAPNDSSTTIQALRIALDGIERSDAMLHGAEPVSQTYKLNEPSGNSPVIPDGWISCSERMPEDTKMLLAFSQGEIVAAYWNWVVNPIDYKKYRAFTYLSGNILDDVTHWMPLPEPPL
mgnify:CR=1 FL=1|nr:MAG TPA: Replicative helicase [Caudoviricetes sp.]